MSFAFELTANDLAQHAQDLETFHREFKPFFQTATRDVSDHALEYLKGQLLCESRRNMSKMSVQISSKNEQALDHFVSNSPWKDKPLLEAIRVRAVERLSSRPGARGLILDESGNGKKGRKSVGVARQYCGSLGKVDNCQVGVYLAYSNSEEVTLIDHRLFLPGEWIEDPKRCDGAGVPQERRAYQTKAELGLDMILEAARRGTPFDFIGMDDHYGEQPWLLSRLDATSHNI